jgi:hypothetical protein
MNLVSLIFKFFIGHLALIHKGTIAVKLQSSGVLALSISPFVYAVDKIMDWTTLNQEYVSFVFIAIMIDHILGTIIHGLIKKDFSLKKNIIGLFTKVGLVVAMGFLFEGIQSIVKEDSFAKEYLIIVLRLTVFLYPAGSAFMNSAIITKGKFPPIGWINKIKSFQTDLDIAKLREKP